MIFHEIYGCYFQVVSKIIERAIEGELTEKEMYEIADIFAFEESGMVIIPSLKNQDWQLLGEDLETPIMSSPKRPITLLEKRWLKTILQDQRVRLMLPDTFQIDPCVEELEPMFVPEDISYFDQYLDGDPYEDMLYQTHFRMIRNAIRDYKWMEIRYYNSKGFERSTVILPQKIEYSDKEDKFRVIGLGEKREYILNIGRIIECEISSEQCRKPARVRKHSNEKIVFTLVDERKALERAMMKFAHYKKEVEKTGEDQYLVTLEYDPADETDVLIQILSFGTFIHVIEPESMKENIKKRLEKQLTMLQW